VWGEDAVVEEKVDLGPRRQGRQLRQELERFEEQVRRPVAPGPLELQPHATVGQTPQAVLGQRRPEYVATQLLSRA
jgi:hypothetical protein